MHFGHMIERQPDGLGISRTPSAFWRAARREDRRKTPFV